MLLSLTPTGGPELVLIDGDTPSPWVLVGQDWGNAAWEHQYAGARGTQGARAAQGALPNRTVRLQLRLYGDSTDHMAGLLEELAAVMDRMRRLGGRITRRAHGQTHRQHMEVLATTGLNAGEWTTVTDTRSILGPVMEFVCAPYAVGDPMAFVDPAADIPDRYGVVTGGLGNLVLGAEGLLGITSASAHLLVEGLRSYRYGDVQVAAWCKPGSTAAGDRRWGVLLRYIDPENWLAATIEQASGSGFVRLRSCIAGTQTVLAEGSVTSLATTAGTGTWVMGTIEGEQVTIVHSLINAERVRRSPPTAWSPSGAVRVTHTLSGTAKAMWGPGTEGQVGLYALPQDASGSGGWLALHVQPAAHQGGQQASSPGIRRHWPILTNIPGSAPALGEVAITRDSAATTGAPVFGLLAWARRTSGWNRCTNGAFAAGHAGGLSNTVGWAVTALSGITAAATSITALTGGGAATLVMTTTSLSGAAYTMQHEFRRGRTYRAVCEVQVASGSPSVQLCLGVSGDLAASTGTAPAAAPGWTEMSVEWTPTATAHGGANLPAVAIRATSTAGGSVVIRRVQVIDTTETATIDTQTHGRGAIPPIGMYTEGGGGLVVESSTGGTLTVANNATESAIFHRQILMNPISGAGSLLMSVLVDPHLVDADDYTGAGSVDVEVWVRAGFSVTVLGPRMAAWVTHPRAASTTDTLGTRRAIAPWGTAGRPLPALGDFWRLYRLGILTIPVAGTARDPTAEPVRLVLRMSWQAGSSGGAYVSGVVLAPARSRALTPSGLQLSAGGYPSLIGLGDSSAVVSKVVGPDLAGAIRDTQARGLVGAAGLGGSLIELPAGPDLELMVLTADQVPDDPAPAAAGVKHSDRIELAVSPTPRWSHLRDITPPIDIGAGGDLPLAFK